MARLERGAVKPEQFDYRFLRFGSGEAGEVALARLTRSTDPVIARSARNVSAVENRWDDTDVGSPNRAPEYEVAPAGSALPVGFAVPVAPTDERAECNTASACVVRARDMNGDGAPEVLLANQWAIKLWTRDASGAWSKAGQWISGQCHRPGAARTDMRDVLREDDLRPVAPVWPELEIAGVRSAPFDIDRDCRREIAAAAGAR